MKNRFIIFSLLFFTNNLFSQKVKVTAETGGLIIGNKNMNISFFEFEKYGKNKYPYFFATKKNHAPIVFSLDSIFEKNITELEIKFKSTNIKVFENKLNCEKIKFEGVSIKQHPCDFCRGYNTPSDGMKLPWLTYTKQQINQFISANLNNFNYNISYEDEVFKEKRKDIKYILKLNPIYYTHDTKGTAGFIIRLVVEWSLCDYFTNEIIYKRITGSYINNSSIISPYESIKLALEEASSALAMDENLIKLLNTTKKTENFNQSVGIKLEPNDTKGLTLEEQINQTMVTIKSSSKIGKGFIISNTGYLLTSNSNIEDSLNIDAEFGNGLTLPIKRVSFNSFLNVALCKISGNGSGYKTIAFDTIKNTMSYADISFYESTQENLNIFARKKIVLNTSTGNNIPLNYKMPINSIGSIFFNSKNEIIGMSNLTDNIEVFQSIQSIFKVFNLSIQ